MNEIRCPSCGTMIPLPPARKSSGVGWGLGCLIAVCAVPVVVAVMGVLAAIAVPAFVRAREEAQRSACAANLAVIEAVKEQMMVEPNRSPGDALDEAEVLRRARETGQRLVCPNGGSYRANARGQEPACSAHGTLSEARQGGRRRPRPGREPDVER